MVPFRTVAEFAALMLVGDIIGVIVGILLAAALKIEEAGTTWKLLVLVSILTAAYGLPLTCFWVQASPYFPDVITEVPLLWNLGTLLLNILIFVNVWLIFDVYSSEDQEKNE
ncbi:MAG: hypothetical protein GF309_08035 [Candidatus Lokiarchaeota archaeon]|nr:hypothetical protein [Candidatus Lokiarchaeota archaeon]